MAFEPKNFEKKWQENWDAQDVFKAETGSSKPKYYVLDMFPYPSSSGLHVGHPEGYTATDIISRYKRALGFNVLHPMGWDAFGLPAEQYALQTGVHPAITTDAAINNFRTQLKNLGFSFDWSRELSTCDPKYYKWTQSIFLKLYEKGLAYKKEVPVNWCPELKTVLANDEIEDGKSVRGGHPVTRVPMRQWMLKITDYAERLLQGLDNLDWPHGTKELQRNWIGKSEGLQCFFSVADSNERIEIYTTRPDTIFGATYMVLAPEHPLVNKITTAEQKSAITTYQQASASKSELSRQEETAIKTGVFTGAFAINPYNDEKIPVWIADYVLMGYGTGGIMAVPAHDQRDWDFAKTFNLKIIKVIEGGQDGTECFNGEGVAINSGFLDGLSVNAAIAAATQWAEAKKIGKKSIQYRLRDWLFSRQRYWGEPFPIIFDESGQDSAVATNALPVELPKVQSYEPTGSGESPLAAMTDWVQTPEGFKRETDTMPGSAGSSWYFLRYCDPHNEEEFCSKAAENYWMPVDLYLGGPEHAVGHLLYARFWTKVLFDAGLVSHDEPFKQLLHQGMILGEDGEKMSKSRGNVVNPDEVVKEYGADSLRLYEMFLGPLDKDKPWSTKAIEGVYRFLQRVWRVYADDNNQLHISEGAATDLDRKLLHKTIKKVTEDIENYRFNTAISQMMVFIKHCTALKGRAPREILKPFVQLLNPFAPHIAEELWEMLGEKESLTWAPWPKYDASLTKDETVTVAVQVLGKTRGKLEVDPAIDQAEIEALAKAIPAVIRQIEGKTIRKVIYVKGRIVNIVAN